MSAAAELWYRPDPPAVGGYVRCNACNKFLRLFDHRRTPHPETPACKSKVIHRAYRARGWQRVNATLARILEEAGVPIERALAGLHEVYVPANEIGGGRKYWALREVAFAPNVAVQAAGFLAGESVKPAMRRRAIGLMYRDPEVFAGADTVHRSVGTVRVWLRRRLKEAV